MLKITTASGAVYLDDQQGRVQRLTGPYSPGIDYATRPDSVWHTVEHQPEWAVGLRTYIDFVGGFYRLTTSVVSIEEVDE